ncbi:MAG: hypothetical protein ACOX6V_00085 [Patescibacteria group bacterium]|jgi:hypothetical protein
MQTASLTKVFKNLDWENFTRELRIPFLMCLLLLVGMMLSQKINLTTADLGRHIKNGEYFLNNLKPIDTNYYSYTQPDHKTINHHWATGPLFYLIWKHAGFAGLSLVYVLTGVLTFFTVFKTAQSKANFTLASLLSLLALPLLTSRREVRPEIFSYLFAAAFYYFLNKYKSRKIPLSVILLLFLLQVVWVNLHILFPVGIMLVGLFMLDSFVSKNSKSSKLSLGILLSVVCTACLLNPYGFSGALVPFTIFMNYGYTLAENQSVFFMQQRFHLPIYIVVEMLAGFLFVTFIPFIKTNPGKYWLRLVLAVVFTALAFHMVRNFPLLGLFFIPLAAENIYLYLINKASEVKRIVYQIGGVAVVVMLIFSFSTQDHIYSAYVKNQGLGLMPGVQKSAQFFKRVGIKGPIFNNYDVGGYLIFNLFPEEKVFIDNRPEAYSTEFMQDTYIQMQEDENFWQEMDEKYNFNVIYYYRHDMTPWGQPFLVKRINDDLWEPVFVDDYCLVMLKRNEKNKTLIEKYALPKTMFRVQ